LRQANGRLGINDVDIAVCDVSILFEHVVDERDVRSMEICGEARGCQVDIMKLLGVCVSRECFITGTIIANIHITTHTKRKAGVNVLNKVACGNVFSMPAMRIAPSSRLSDHHPASIKSILFQHKTSYISTTSIHTVEQ
jgi:hypothetical protein